MSKVHSFLSSCINKYKLFSRRQSSRIHKDDCWKIFVSRAANIAHYSWIRKLEDRTKKKKGYEDRLKLSSIFRFDSILNDRWAIPWEGKLEQQNSRDSICNREQRLCCGQTFGLIRREWRTNVCTGFNWQWDAGCLRISKCVARWTGEMCIIRRMFALLRHCGFWGDGVW